MIGAIVGDIVGSKYEHRGYKSKDFALFSEWCRFTDDSVMTLAVAKAILECEGDYEHLSLKATECMRTVGVNYPYCGYGYNFRKWLYASDPCPYNSLGNGAAMRVSPIAYAAKNEREVKELSRRVTEVTHNHPEGIKGAEATAMCVFLALNKATMPEIKEYVIKNYYPLDFTLDGIRKEYRFDLTCQGSVPQAIEAFLESDSFEDAVRNAVSLGGDSDTLAAITGGIAEAYYGVPGDIREKALTFLDDELRGILETFEKRFVK